MLRQLCYLLSVSLLLHFSLRGDRCVATASAAPVNMMDLRLPEINLAQKVKQQPHGSLRGRVSSLGQDRALIESKSHLIP